MRPIPCKLLWLPLALLACAGCAANRGFRGTMQGRVAASPASERANSRDKISDAVVYLERIPPELERQLSREPGEVVITQRDHAFSPRVSPIPVGATVRFENRDQIYQNVFSVSPARPFDVGKYKPGQSRKIRFDNPGVVKLFSDIDPSMAGYVFVVPHRAFTQPDATGAFVISGLPRGDYTLKVWHPTLGALTRKVVMPRRGNLVVDLRF